VARLVVGTLRGLADEIKAARVVIGGLVVVIVLAVLTLARQGALLSHCHQVKGDTTGPPLMQIQAIGLAAATEEPAP